MTVDLSGSGAAAGMRAMRGTCRGASQPHAVVDPGQRVHAAADAGQPGAARACVLAGALAEPGGAGGGERRRRGPAVGPAWLSAAGGAAARARRSDHRPARRPGPCLGGELRALPGVGAYTAAAVASFAFGQRHAVLDTNVRRVLARLVTGESLPGRLPSVAERRLAESLLPAGRQAGGPVVGRRDGTRRPDLHGGAAALRRLPGRRAVRLAGRAAARRPSAGARQPRYEGSDRQCRGRRAERAADRARAGARGRR